MKSQIINKIVDEEWEMFQKTQNVGGRASCQDNKPTFYTMRVSQFTFWNDECIESYLCDVEEAAKSGDNLVTYKYGYMMKATDPIGYEDIKDRLPEISEEKSTLVERLVEQTLSWCDEFNKKYPNIAKSGRPVRTGEEIGSFASIETYCRGEVSTYSKETLKKLVKMYEDYAKTGFNLQEHVVALEAGLESADQLQRLEESISQRFQPLP